MGGLAEALLVIAIEPAMSFWVSAVGNVAWSLKHSEHSF
jgi:hypothetical protein